MPSGNGGGGSGPSLPPSLQADHRRFASAIAPWLERLPLGIQYLQLLTRYGLLVEEWAGRLSIVSKGDRGEIFTRHVLDSLNPVSLFANPPRTALDVGSGAGFPGIPLAIVWPTTRWFLVESREKKAGFLEKAVRELGLGNVKVVCARVEDLAPAGAGTGPGLLEGAPMESVFVRAVGGLPGLLETVGPITAPEAKWVYFLGAASDASGLAASLGPHGMDARVEAGAFGGLLFHGSIPSNVPRGTLP